MVLCCSVTNVCERHGAYYGALIFFCMFCGDDGHRLWLQLIPSAGAVQHSRYEWLQYFLGKQGMYFFQSFSTELYIFRETYVHTGLGLYLNRCLQPLLFHHTIHSI